MFKSNSFFMWKSNCSKRLHGFSHQHMTNNGLNMRGKTVYSALSYIVIIFAVRFRFRWTLSLSLRSALFFRAFAFIRRNMIHKFMHVCVCAYILYELHEHFIPSVFPYCSSGTVKYCPSIWFYWSWVELNLVYWIR